MSGQTTQSRSLTIPLWPRSAMGWAALIAAAIDGAVIGLLLFALPMIGEVLDAELVPGLFNTWFMPLALVVLTGLVALLSVTAWRRGDRSVLGLLVMILALAGGAFLVIDVVLEALAGR